MKTIKILFKLTSNKSKVGLLLNKNPCYPKLGVVYCCAIINIYKPKIVLGTVIMPQKYYKNIEIKDESLQFTHIWPDYIYLVLCI